MGQSLSSPYSNSPRIQKALVNGTWHGIPRQTVSMNDSVYNNPFQHKYIVKLNDQVPSYCNMTVIFPNHPIEEKRLLWVRQYSQNGLSKEINRRIRDSAREGVVLAITAGDEIISFKGFTGNIYLFWAERASQETINRQENLIGENVPILIETNTQMGYRNVYIFEADRYTVTALRDISWFEPINSDLFCCESDARKDEMRIVATVSNTVADQVTKEPVVRSLSALENDPIPFQSDDESDLLTIDSGRLINYSIHGDASTPDEQ